MMTIYYGVCQIYTPLHTVHLRYPCLSVQPPSLLEDVLDRVNSEIYSEAVIE